MENHQGAMVFIQGNKIRTLFMTSSCKDTIVIAKASVDSDLWHCRLGHISEKGMKMLLSKGKLSRLKSIEHSLCKGCIFGKHKRIRFFFFKLEENQKQKFWKHSNQGLSFYL